MSSTGRIIDIAHRALAAQQVGLSVTGHNIANVNTPGYARQRVTLEQTTPLLSEWGYMGTGVSIQNIERIRDGFVDSEIRTEKQSLGKWEYRERIMQEIEDVFSEPSDSSLGMILSNFWDSWGELANDPQSGSAREGVRQSGLHLANMLNHLHGRLTNIQTNLDNELKLTIEEMNSVLHQIADLNEKISSTENQGVVANDYRDRRDKLIEDLYGLAGVNVVERDNGMVSITLDGKVLVERSTVSGLSTLDHSLGHVVVADVTWAIDKSPIAVVSGKLQGIIEMRDEVITEQLEKMNEIANTLVTKVNEIHQTGYGQNGSVGIDFFSNATTDARDIALSTPVSTDAAKIAASGDGSAGDSSVAMQIFELHDIRIMSGDSVTIDDYYAAMMGAMGLQSQEATFMRENQEFMVQQLENQRSSISGVSLDEEMTNLIRYQHAYEAAARLVTVVDEMMQTILDMV